MEGGDAVKGRLCCFRMAGAALRIGQQIEDLRLVSVHCGGFLKECGGVGGMTLVEGSFAEIEGDGPGVRHQDAGAFEIGPTFGVMRGLNEKSAEEVEGAAIL